MFWYLIVIFDLAALHRIAGDAGVISQENQSSRVGQKLHEVQPGQVPDHSSAKHNRKALIWIAIFQIIFQFKYIQ